MEGPRHVGPLRIRPVGNWSMWLKCKRNGKAFLPSPCLSVHERLLTVRKDWKLHLPPPGFLYPETVQLMETMYPINTQVGV